MEKVTLDLDELSYETLGKLAEALELDDFITESDINQKTLNRIYNKIIELENKFKTKER